VVCRSIRSTRQKCARRPPSQIFQTAHSASSALCFAPRRIAVFVKRRVLNLASSCKQANLNVGKYREFSKHYLGLISFLYALKSFAVFPLICSLSFFIPALILFILEQKL
jgi:uncharacterized membrane protein YesL